MRTPHQPKSGESCHVLKSLGQLFLVDDTLCRANRVLFGDRVHTEVYTKRRTIRAADDNVCLKDSVEHGQTTGTCHLYLRIPVGAAVVFQAAQLFRVKPRNLGAKRI